MGTIHTPEGPETVRWITRIGRNWAIYRDEQWYVLTHIPTGRSLAYSLHFREARAIAVGLLASGLDWSSSDLAMLRSPSHLAAYYAAASIP